MGTFLLKTAFLLAMAANLLPCHAVEEILTNGCMALNRDINFEDSEPGPYRDEDLQNDFDGFTYFKRRDMASIADIDGSKYLDVKLHGGCVGTVGDAGCGLQGALPLFDMGASATLEYIVRFSDGYDFRRGGKLMGLCSGECKTGCMASADQMSTRIMWGPEGSLYLYTYTYSGATLTCGMNTKPDEPVRLQPGQDYRIRLTVQMNDPESDNGMASLYVDGQHIVTAEGLRMRSSPDQVVDSMVFHTFFGGSGDEWAAAKDEHIMFKSIKVWDGDCGGDDNALALESAAWEPAFGGPPEGARELGLNSYIDGSWNGRFCLQYEITNDGEEPCDRFILETNVNPRLGTLDSYGKLKVLEGDEASGFYMFTRSEDKHGYIGPGKMRTGNVCYSTPRNIIQSAGRIMSGYHFNAYCEP